VPLRLPTWLHAVSHGNPVTSEVAGLRGFLIGQHTNLSLDFGVLTGAATAGICAAAGCSAVSPADGQPAPRARPPRRPLALTHVVRICCFA
jgi:hypothetical protein